MVNRNRIFKMAKDQAARNIVLEVIRRELLITRTLACTRPDAQFICSYYQPSSWVESQDHLSELHSDLSDPHTHFITKTPKPNQLPSICIPNTVQDVSLSSSLWRDGRAWSREDDVAQRCDAQATNNHLPRDLPQCPEPYQVPPTQARNPLHDRPSNLWQGYGI